MARWEHISNIWAGRGVGSVLGVCGRTGVACWRSENLVKTHHTNRCERFKRKGNQTKQISPSLKLDVESVFLCSSHSVIHSLAKHKLALRHHLNMEGYRKTRLQTRRQIDQMRAYRPVPDTNETQGSRVPSQNDPSSFEQRENSQNATTLQKRFHPPIQHDASICEKRHQLTQKIARVALWVPSLRLIQSILLWLIGGLRASPWAQIVRVFPDTWGGSRTD